VDCNFAFFFAAKSKLNLILNANQNSEPEMSQSQSQPRKKSIFLSKHEHVPDDVVYDILSWLPVKSLMRYRCVSKYCNSIITDPIFITIHNDRANSLLSHKNKNNGYLLYSAKRHNHSSCNELYTFVYNKDRTLTEISSFQIPLSHTLIVDSCNGMFFLSNYRKNLLYLWNPSIRKFKMLPPNLLGHLLGSVAHGLAYHSQKNDFKILRIVFQRSLADTSAEVYTLSTDSWRRVVISMESELNIGSINYKHISPCLFFNGALHSIVYSEYREQSFILSFDVNDERFRKIMLPQNYLDEPSYSDFEHLAMIKGSLALIVFSTVIDKILGICQIWVMREYGVVESWTKKWILINWFHRSWGCTDNGELLIENANGLFSFDPESLNENILAIEDLKWVGYTANSMESLALLDGVNVNV
jgi:F-box interacting protein